MNEMNQWETQLRSWKPRHPSPKLERFWRNPARLNNVPRWVSHDATKLRSAPDCADSPLKWFVLARAAGPVLACLLLTAAILTQSGQGLMLPSPDQPAIALALSNQNFAPYLRGSFQPTANRLDTFGWTNGSGSPSSMRSLTPSKAIDLQ